MGSMSDESIRRRKGWQVGDAAVRKILWPLVIIITIIRHSEFCVTAGPVTTELPVYDTGILLLVKGAGRRFDLGSNEFDHRWFKASQRGGWALSQGTSLSMWNLILFFLDCNAANTISRGDCSVITAELPIIHVLRWWNAGWYNYGQGLH